MSDDIEAIASKLSESQRNALLNGRCAIPLGKDERADDCICMSALAHNLVEIGLAYPRERYPGGIVRTPLGLAVRAHLRRLSTQLRFSHLSRAALRMALANHYRETVTLLNTMVGLR